MKLSKLVCLSLLAITIDASAYSIISEKITSSPGFNAYFEPGNKKVELKKTLSPTFANAISWAYDAQGKPMEYIKVQGDHNISITNDTGKRTRFTYEYTLSCSNAYANFQRTIEMNPHESFSDSSHSYGVVQERDEGAYGIHVGTKIDGGEYSFHQRDATLRVRR